ncbi:hypothetical protein C2845_PM16G00740 [Panicum miliaceum]|uniref:BED-type domain-containing protein n=1 Tax=Panicum miliaceum TaxID=4540 RepID=A0A3L6PYM9_PANMI|nr:hypothetical protein C2845_PM16G00740 [Panicum miliaceum]
MWTPRTSRWASSTRWRGGGGRQQNLERISKEELYDFWLQISDQSFDARLQIFFDMSNVWKDFELTMLEDGSYKAICKHCKKDYVAGNRAGTSHLKYHIRVCPDIQSSRRRKFGSPKLDIPIFDQQRSREDFSRMVLAHGYSFNMAEHYYTGIFLYNLQPSFKLVHRTTLKDDCMKIYEEEKLKVYQVFEKQPGRFSLTSDMWTHTEMSGCMSITAYYIDDEWNFHKRLIGFAHVEVPQTDCLKVFYEVTKRVSGTKYPTLSLYFNDFYGIYLLLHEWQFRVNAFVASTVVPMVDKFEKYWDIANKLLEIATILDPRYKMKSIEYYYRLIYDPFVAELRIESARKSFLELFGEYASQPSQTSSDANSSRNFEAAVPSSAQSPSSLFATRLGLEKFIYESNSSRHSKSELEIYLEDPSSPGIGNSSFDILAWWRVNGPKYPIISRMARDILSVPLSTVASESTFSSAKRILDDYRCNQLSETIEAIMCSHDWLKGRHIPSAYFY